MISPTVGIGTLVAGFLLGALPPSLLAMGPRWGESLGWAAAFAASLLLVDNWVRVRIPTG